MKNSPKELQAAKRMKPGEITAEGFLGNDARSLPEIIAGDEAEMRHHNLNFEEASQMLREFMDRAIKAQGNEITVEGKWLVSVQEARGRLPCPYGDCLCNKNFMTVTRLSNEHSIGLSDLSLHLLQAHHFLQGKGSPFHIEPGMLKAVLK